MEVKKLSILVTGAPRSGTTFLGAMLSLASGTVEIEEPFNFETGIVGMDRPFLYMPTTVKLGAEDQKYAALIEQLLEGSASYKPSPLRNSTTNPLKQLARLLLVSRQNLGYKLQGKNPFVARYVIKDPNACFMAEYMDAHFPIETVVIMRHPAATIASYKRLGWRYSLRDLQQQQALMNDFLDPILGSIDAMQLSDIEAWSYLWLSVYTVLVACIKRDKKIIFVNHNELSQHPQELFERLYGRLGLDYTEHIRAEVDNHTNEDNPAQSRGGVVHDLYRDSAAVNQQWKHVLTPAEVKTIHRITAPIADNYFSEDSWQ